MRNRILGVIALVSFFGISCALNSAKQVGFQGFAVAHTSFMLARNVEKDLVCGLPQAPTAPLCVPDSIHGQILEIEKKALTIDIDLGKLVQSVPEGSPLPSDVGRMVGELSSLIGDILKLIPTSPQKAALAEKVAVK